MYSVFLPLYFHQLCVTNAPLMYDFCMTIVYIITRNSGTFLCTNRYSKLARETLTLDNASVADLSDPYRPTKLGEMFGELYDNEWTDAFEEMADMDDKGKIDQLLGMLKVWCYIYR